MVEVKGDVETRRRAVYTDDEHTNQWECNISCVLADDLRTSVQTDGFLIITQTKLDWMDGWKEFSQLLM